MIRDAHPIPRREGAVMLALPRRAIARAALIRRSRAWPPGPLLLLALLVLASCSDGQAGAIPTRSAVTATPTSVTLPCAATAAGAHTPATPPVVYVALAASDGNGVGAAHPFTQGYVPLLITRMPAGSRCLNLSVSGTTLHEALSTELPLALQAQPSLVTVWLVGNDFSECVSLQNYAADLDTLLGALSRQTRAHVFVADLPDMSQVPRFQHGAVDAGPCLQGADTSQVRALAARWDSVIATAVTHYGATLVDLFGWNLAAHPELIASDGFHPSAAGYAQLADFFWAQIQAHGGVPQG
jgi:acyl-CoA thioesterase-1